MNINSKKIDFIEKAIEAGDFDEDVIKLLKAIIIDYKRLKKEEHDWQLLRQIKQENQL